MTASQKHSEYKDCCEQPTPHYIKKPAPNTEKEKMETGVKALPYDLYREIATGIGKHAPRHPWQTTGQQMRS